MNALYSLWEKLTRSKKYRESFAASVAKRMIPVQIRVLRKQRGWSQEELAKQSKISQGVISRAEDPDYGNLSINTLTRIASGFDCAFIAHFVPFSKLGNWYSDLTNEKTLQVPSFENDRGFGPSSLDARLQSVSAFPSTAINTLSHGARNTLHSANLRFIETGPQEGNGGLVNQYAEWRAPIVTFSKLTKIPPTAATTNYQHSYGLGLEKTSKYA